MKLWLTIFAVLVVMGGGVTGTAQAHFLYHHKNLTLDRKISYFQRSITHDEGAIEWLKRVRQNLRRDVSVFHSRESIANDVYQNLQFHKNALAWHRALLRYYQAKWNRLHPPAPSYSSSLWECIHRREGNDSAGTYTGPLQMTYPWEGHYVDWYNVPISTVYAIAQQEYADHGFSRVWLFQQFPNTAPPCVS